jgi:hypothetical protein
MKRSLPFRPAIAAGAMQAAIAGRHPGESTPKGAVIHGNRRPLLGRKLAGKSQSELRDLGLVVEPPPSGKPAEDSDV